MMLAEESDPLGGPLLTEKPTEFRRTAELRPMLDESGRGLGDLVALAQCLLKRQRLALDADRRVFGEAGDLQNIRDHRGIVYGGDPKRVAGLVAEAGAHKVKPDVTGFLARSPTETEEGRVGKEGVRTGRIRGAREA